MFEKGLSGGMVFDEQPFTAYAPNITPDIDTGIGAWSDADLGRAIRDGLRPDGSTIGPPMPISFYRHIADSDLEAIIAYLRAQPPVRNIVKRSVYRIPLPADYGAPTQTVIAPRRSDAVRYGEYLANIGHCMECHTPRDTHGMLRMNELGSGGQAFHGPWGESIARNLTPDASGLKNWTDAQIIAAVREDSSPTGRHYKPPMAFQWYRNISDDDMQALLAYLRSLPPHPFGGRR